MKISSLPPAVFDPALAKECDPKPIGVKGETGGFSGADSLEKSPKRSAPGQTADRLPGATSKEPSPSEEEIRTLLMQAKATGRPLRPAIPDWGSDPLGLGRQDLIARNIG